MGRKKQLDINNTVIKATLIIIREYINHPPTYQLVCAYLNNKGYKIQETTNGRRRGYLECFSAMVIVGCMVCITKLTSNLDD